MKTRTITGFFFIIVMIASMLLTHYVFGVFYLLLSAFCLWEFYGLIKKSGFKPNVSAGILNGVLIYVVFALITYKPDPVYFKLLFLLALTMSAISVQELYKKNDAPFTNIAYTYMGLIYVIVPFTFFHALAYLNGIFSFHIPLAFLIILWSNDTGAYLSGRFLGKMKLFERHSPKKTWEGFVGGVLIAALAAYILSNFYHELSREQWMIMAILIGCFGTLGDLIESMFKRSINVKDSGGILPGHGGLLDRFDGLLLSAPIVYAYLYLITKS